MHIDAEVWSTVSTLLDEWLDLPEASREGWLDRLAPEYANLIPTLRRLLAQADTDGNAFLKRLPTLTGPTGDAAGGSSAGLAAAEAMVGPYRLIRQLGRGGMAVVWLAERADGLLNRPVALKLPLVSPHHSHMLAERFDRERDILAQLTNPRIAHLYDAGVTASGQSYLALEYVEGECITQHCDTRRLGIEGRLKLFLEVLRAVECAQTNQIVHRDLKPSNILVNGQGEVRLLDFGIAKLLTEGEAHETELTQWGGRILTPEYASPEQILGEPVGTGSDVYSLGVILYELLTGERPDQRKSAGARTLEAGIVDADLIPPSRGAPDEKRSAARGSTPACLAAALKGDLDAIVLQALRRRPKERYATAAAFAQDVQRYLDQQPVQARREKAWYRARKFVRRNRTAVSAGAAVAALGLGWAFHAGAFADRPGRLTGIRSLAVLPLKPVGSERDEILELGVAEALIARLSRLRDLAVRPGDEVRTYTGPGQDALRAARELNVDAVLAGTLKADGGRLAITLRLLLSGGRTLWSAGFSEQRAGLLALENGMAQRLAALLSKQGPEPPAHSGGPVDPEAFRQYLEGRYLFAQRNLDSFSKAIEKFEVAVARDPGYAGAHAALAEVLLIYPGYRAISQQAVIGRERQHAARPAELDPGVVEPYRIQALVAGNFEYDRRKAEDLYRRALAIAPNDGTTHHFFGEMLGLMGRFDEAEREFEIGYALEPRSLSCRPTGPTTRLWRANGTSPSRAPPGYSRSTEVRESSGKGCVGASWAPG